MNYRFPQKVSENRLSLIRETADRGRAVPGFISFAMGNPAAETIPVDLISQSASEVLCEDPMSILQYGPATGDPKLLAWIKNRLVRCKDAPEKGNKVMLLAGSGKGLALVPRTLCTEGDAAFCDAFSYPNSFNCMRNAGVVPIGIPADEAGMIPELLEEKARQTPGKYLYLIPNFQNPTGRTMPLERRKEIYRIAQKYDLIIYEDDPYGEIRFRGEEIPSIKSLDTDGRVLYAGSFSKTLSAGLRVGFLYGPDALIDKLISVKDADGQDPLYSQKIIVRCLEKMDYDAHLKSISEVYARKCGLITRGLREHCPDVCRFSSPDGGMFVWVTLPEGTDVIRLNDALIGAGVGAVRSEAFSVMPEDPGHAFRLNFSAPSDTDIRKGTEIFGQTIRKYLSA